jgi:hypothetical protein
MGEQALIVWDEAHHTEHFVRTATFDTTAKSFGFLVPTPSQPTLAEARDEVFSTLEEATRPRTEYVDEWVPEPVGCTAFFLSAARGPMVGAAAPAVRVLDEQHVAGLDATVLAASDTAALAEWLRGRGFAMRDALQRWLGVYVQKGWNVVAFRYDRPDLAGHGAGDSLHSSAVRITFRADAPVYPFLEPDDAPEVPGRQLRLYVAADRRLDGLLPDGPSGPWQAKALMAAPVDVPAALASTLPGVELPARFWLHEFSDPTTKRPPSDLVFRPSASTAELRPPPYVVPNRVSLPIPYELPFVGGAIFLWWRRRRARARHAAVL